MRIEEIRKNCTGCEACHNSCEHSISMKYNKEGFLVPSIDKGTCKKCKKCERVCPALERINETGITTIPDFDTYVGYCKDDNIRKNSTSGGIFSLLAKNYVKNNGIVYGAAFDKDFHVKHIRATTIDDIKRISSSKYVQSEIGLILREVERDLKEGKKVLFSGCGCQIAGLKKFLGLEYENLLTVAIVCHGVPSPQIWDKYISKYKGVKKVEFRNKEKGWEQHKFKIKTSEKEYVWSDLDNEYMYAFCKDINIRKSCYDCKYKSYKSESDLMIGDAWGIKKCKRKLFDDKGVSIIITYSQKGKDIISSLSNEVCLEKEDSVELYKNNTKIIKSVQHNTYEKKFEKLIRIIPNNFCIYLIHRLRKKNEK